MDRKPRVSLLSTPPLAPQSMAVPAGLGGERAMLLLHFWVLPWVPDPSLAREPPPAHLYHIRQVFGFHMK